MIHSTISVILSERSESKDLGGGEPKRPRAETED